MIQTAEIFQDRMMLQQKKEVKIWGKSGAGDVITAQIQGKTGRTTADNKGDWCVTLPELTASEQETLVLENGGERLEFHEVAVGEVWIAGGQSNMEFKMRYEKYVEEEKKNLVQNPNIRFFDVPQACFEGQRELMDYSRSGFWRMATPEDLDYFSAAGYYFQKELAENLNVPVGIIGCNWGGSTASVWMKKESVERVGKPWMDDYLEQISQRDMDAFWENQRKNCAEWSWNPFADKVMEFLMPKTPTEEDLKEFYRQTGIDIREMFSHSYFLPQVIPGCMYEYMLKTIAPYTVRGVLWYQGEGDTPPGRNVIYKDMLTALIGDWRQLWNNEELPFLVVQIPGWRKYLRDDMNSTGYKVLRERQQETADTVPGVYLCSISDAGEEFDIHPKDKKTVGERLALLAEGHVYGQDILCDAPRAAGFERENNCITVSFDHAPGGLYSKEPEISALEIYEGERQVPFKAWAEGNCVKIVLEKETEETVEIRFAQTGWYLVNLYNQAGIPAIPFKARV